MESTHSKFADDDIKLREQSISWRAGLLFTDLSRLEK